MSQHIPRKSIIPPSIIRSSASGPNLSQAPRVPEITGRPSSIDRKSNTGGGRASSIDRQSNIGGGRASSIGRASIGNFKTSDGKTITPADMAIDVLNVLQDLDFKVMPISLKILQLPSTTLFYSVFEFLLKNIGIDDPWNADRLPSNANDKKSNIASTSQPSVQSSNVAQNKIRVELIIFYLEILKFNNVPKPSALQTMTTPKNWTHMLQIMQFLANDCLFLFYYDLQEVMEALSDKSANLKTNKILHQYMKIMFDLKQQDPTFPGTERHGKMIKEMKEKMWIEGRDGNDLGKLEEKWLEVKTRHKNALEKQERFENTIKEELDLKNKLTENEKLLETTRKETEEKRKKLKLLRAKAGKLRGSLKEDTVDIKSKEIQYDKQLKSGMQVQSLQNRSLQKAKELESLQITFVDLEEKKDELQMLLMNKTQEVKDVIKGINDKVKEITLNSSLDIKEFPQFDIMDFHKKHDLIKQYKEQLLEIRKDYNENICKLPEELSKCRVEYKLVENKISNSKSKITTLENQIKSREEFFTNTKEEREEMRQTLEQEIGKKIQELSEIENKRDQYKGQLTVLNNDLSKTEEMVKRIKEEQETEVRISKESYMNTEHENIDQLKNHETQCVGNILTNTSILEQFKTKLQRH